ncbi:MAG: hypothetical protein IKI29_01925 [Clostridia bacterium]|nr:hypothetical protein [Clostridia bacterium]
MAKGKYEAWLDADKLSLLAAWTRDGLKEEQIAHNIGIRRETLSAWKKRFPEIAAALKRDRETVDVAVEDALCKKALGYTVALRKTFKCREVQYDESGHKVAEADVLREGVDEVYVPADTKAQSFWLKNRRPDRWRDKTEHQIDTVAQIEFVDDLDGEEDG